MNTIEQKFEKVMLIDDNNIDLYVNAQVIARSNFSKEVLQYSSASKALEYLTTSAEDRSLPEVIFVDIYMPGMSGFEFMEAYDQLSAAIKEHCCVYIISSSIDKQDIDRAQADSNVIAFHQKPLSKALLETISKCG